MQRKYTLGLYEKSMPPSLSWREKLEKAKSAGFDFVEISIDETDEKLSRLDMSQAERMELANIMKVVGLPIRTMCLSGHRKYPLGSHSPQIRARSMEIMEKAIGLAGDLGIRIVQIAGYDVYYEESDEETRRIFLENLKRSAEMAAREGVVLGFETMETPFMNTVSKSMKYVNLVNSLYLTVYPDIGNITNSAREYGTDVLEDLKSGKGHLAAMHLKEARPGVFREVPFGKGHVDFDRAIHTAWDLGVRKFVAEFWYTGSPEWEGNLTFARQMMGEKLDREERRC